MSDLINFSNSILKHFECETFHDTDINIDEVLKGHDKVVVLLFDGMGQNIIRKHLKEKSNIRSHYLETINSTFPPTTAAATTGFLSARYPIETCWIGWDAYFKEYNRNIVLFASRDYNSKEEMPFNVFNIIPYKNICEIINEKNNGVNAITMQRYPINEHGPKTLRESHKKIDEFLKKNDKCFVYYYWDEPDWEMHQNGIDKYLIKKICKKLDRFVKKLVKDNPDTLFLTFADHGHVNVEYIKLDEYPELLELTSQPIAGEKRSSFFFTKEGKQEEFKNKFNSLFGDKFKLLSKQEIYDTNLYGTGTPHPHFDSMMGDFIAISLDKYALIAHKQFKDAEFYPGHHAGGTKEELLIDISAFNK